MKKTINSLIYLFIAIFTFTSCIKDENWEEIRAQKENILNRETLDFKQDVISILKARKNSRAQSLTLSEKDISSLKDKSLIMFESHGFAKNEFNDILKDEKDCRIILLAMMFTAVLETNSIGTLQKTKSRSESLEEEDDSSSFCYDVTQVIVCASRAVVDVIGINEIQKIFTGYSCLTKQVIKSLFKGLVKKLPIIAIVSAIDKFADCMGWYPF